MTEWSQSTLQGVPYQALKVNVPYLPPFQLLPSPSFLSHPIMWLPLHSLIVSCKNETTLVSSNTFWQYWLHSISTLSISIRVFNFPCPFTFTYFICFYNSCDGYEAAPYWHNEEAYNKMSSTKLLVNGKNGYVHAWRWKDIIWNIY